jgi:muconolactone delta-isomerase
MRFLVIAHNKEGLRAEQIGDARVRAIRYREQLGQEGKLIENADIAGQRGHIWVLEVDSVDELDRIMSGDPMNPFLQNPPVILPLCSYDRMAERERVIFNVAADQQASMAQLERESGATHQPHAMRYLVIANGTGLLSRADLGDAPIRANRYREALMRKGKISLHAHIAGMRSHCWLYHVDSVDELDSLMAQDPMALSHQGDPQILPLTSYARMTARQEE